MKTMLIVQYSGSDLYFNSLFLNPILHREGGGAQSACTNFRDLYLRNEYCYSNEIWWLFIKFIREDNGVFIIPIPIKPLP